MGEIFDEPKTDDEQFDFTDMPELESEESAAQRRNQLGKSFKILTPYQMLSRITNYFSSIKSRK